MGLQGLICMRPELFATPAQNQQVILTDLAVQLPPHTYGNIQAVRETRSSTDSG